MSKELPTGYQPELFEDDMYKMWESGGYFKPHETSTAAPFCIIKPPPNVTGVLHMGHALTDTIEDTIVRYKRMKGFNTLFIPGTDHAGIATQMVVERELAQDGISRHELGREKFLKKVWEVKQRHHGIIVKQMRKLGGSLDWSRECFTLDPRIQDAVKKAFCQLYHEGLLYRGERLISWCVKDHTALSDLEVEQKETVGSLWNVRYPTDDNPSEAIIVATTRPETIFADQAIAVHPEDTRYAHVIGKKVRVPGTDRTIPIITDTYVDPTFGSGALKITPGHDFNDYEIGLRHHLHPMMVIDLNGNMTQDCGAFANMSAQASRKAFAKWLDDNGFIESVKDHVHFVGQCQRCHTIVEPLLSTQWFIKIKPLAAPAIEAVKTGKIKMIPDSLTKTYFEWMENIRDWCVSRQLWWGHQIPAYYCDGCDHIMVSETPITVCEKCKSKNVTQDEDVLDTWFSSGLWPLVTLGWPEKTHDFIRFYPNQLMETGYDILFFWVARMIMFGLKFGGDIPFEEVLFHAMVRDEKGHKMSKTRGNVIDPLDVIDTYGSDALRFTLATMSGYRDIKLSLERVSGYRNFMNKIWNSRRFLMLNTAHVSEIQEVNYDELHWINKWILTRLSELTQVMDQAYERYALADAAQAIYQFFWHEYCDWYVEFSKVLYQHPELKSQSLWVGYTVFRDGLKLLHPIAPFITEKLFQELPDSVKDADVLITTEFPTSHPSKLSEKSVERVTCLQEVIGTLRRVRSTAGIPASKQTAVYVDLIDRGLNTHQWDDFINALTRSSSTTFEAPSSTRGLLKGVMRFGVVYVDPAGVIDVQREMSRIKKDLDFVKKGQTQLERKLSNKQFVDNAPLEVVEAEKQKLEELSSKLSLLTDILQTFEQLQ